MTIKEANEKIGKRYHAALLASVMQMFSREEISSGMLKVDVEDILRELVREYSDEDRKKP